MKQSKAITLVLLTSSLFLGCENKVRNQYGSWDDCVRDYQDSSKCESATEQKGGPNVTLFSAFKKKCGQALGPVLGGVDKRHHGYVYQRLCPCDNSIPRRGFRITDTEEKGIGRNVELNILSLVSGINGVEKPRKPQGGYNLLTVKTFFDNIHLVSVWHHPDVPFCWSVQLSWRSLIIVRGGTIWRPQF